MTSPAPGAIVARYAFVANANDNSVSTYVADPLSGRLKYIGKVAAGTTPNSVVTDPTGSYAYVVNRVSGNISQYNIGANGSLTPMTNPTVLAGGTNPWSMTVDHSGKYAYVANASATGTTVSQYTIGSGGALSPMSPATVTAGTNPLAVAINPTSTYAYVANAASNDVSAYAIGAGGALTQISCGAPGTTGCSGATAPTNFAAGTSPMSVIVDPSGKYVYVANSGSSNVSQYAIGAGGSLTPIGTGTVGAGAGAQSIAIDPTGRYAYVANAFNGAGGNSVSQYTIGANGGLMAIGTGSVPSGTSPYSVTVDPTGQFVFATNNGGNNVSQYAIGTGGALAPLAPATAIAFPAPTSLAMTKGPAVQAVPKYAYVADSNSASVYQYNIGTGGGLTAMTTPSVAAGVKSQFVALDPTHRYAYAVNYNDNSISQYNVGANGNLTPMTTPTVTSVMPTGLPESISIDPSGRYAYVGNNSIVPGVIAQFTIGANGALTANGTVNAGGDPYSIAIDPTGRFAYSANWGDGSISAFSIGANGALTQISCTSGCDTKIAANYATGVSGNSTPYFVAIDPSGKYLYVANGGSYVSAYTIGAGGALTAIDCGTGTNCVGTAPSSFVAGTGVSANVSVSPNGAFLYATSTGGFGAVLQFTIGANGSITQQNPFTVATGIQPVCTAIDASGAFAYVAVAGAISQYSVGANGQLTPLATPQVMENNPMFVITLDTLQ